MVADHPVEQRRDVQLCWNTKLELLANHIQKEQWFDLTNHHIPGRGGGQHRQHRRSGGTPFLDRYAATRGALP